MQFENFQNITSDHKSRNARAGSRDFLFIIFSTKLLHRATHISSLTLVFLLVFLSNLFSIKVTRLGWRIDAVLSQFEIKFIQFGRENKSFANLPYDTLCPSFSCNLIGYFKQALKSDWLFSFWCSLLIGWGKDAI